MRARVRPHTQGSRFSGRDVARAVAQQRHRLLRQRREHELAVDAVRQHLAGRRVDDLDEEVVLHDVEAVARFGAFAGDAGADDLAQAVDVDRHEAELGLELRAHRLGPRLRAEHADLQRELVDRDARLAQALGDVERVGRRGAEDLAAEIAQQQRLAGGDAAGYRDRQRAEPLGALVEAEPAGEQPVAVGVVDDHPRADAGHVQAVGHDLGPDVEVVLCVGDDGGPAA